MSEIFELWLDRIRTPIGEMVVAADRDGNLRAAEWTDHEERMHRLLGVHYRGREVRLISGRRLNGLTDAIGRYFRGELEAIAGLPVETSGTPFQRQVWRALREIPCGRTLSYARLAERVGRPAAIRAVGSANGSNPVGVVVPCHRVIGSDGSLTGYAGGIERKRWLLEHEQKANPGGVRTSGWLFSEKK